MQENNHRCRSAVSDAVRVNEEAEVRVRSVRMAEIWWCVDREAVWQTTLTKRDGNW